ncbi:translation initiation factor eIF3 subunit [Viridothelium virens]|uniref:Eukaryotic translation initiation factor 3 subunit J n=1 Tax=Viridothelium virens TaxID=1048519 RepID=A0A6A6HHY8_VIRVR|nr:translation initiation factor eIF3 subunit [Viridothelium virens]
MAPSRNTWDDDSEDSTPPSSPPAPIARRSKFDDEEDSDEVLDSWDAAEDSEVEREKANKAAEAKAKAEAQAKAAHKTKTQRINDNIQRRKEEAAQEDSSEEDEDEAEKRERLRRSEKDSDLKHAEDLFGDIDLNRKRAAPKPAAVVAKTASTTTSSAQNDPTGTVDLASLPLFKPANKDQFSQLRDALVPLLTANAKKPQYSLFLVDFAKALAKELPSDQIKKVASGLTTLSNEKMKEEKAAEKSGKKSKAAKTKTSLVASRDVSTKADTIAYDDGLEDDDFM